MFGRLRGGQWLLAAFISLTGFTSLAIAQHEHSHSPGQLVGRQPDSSRESAHREGLHVNPVPAYAIVGATVHRDPTTPPKIETVIIEHGKIIGVQADAAIPPGVNKIDATGLHLYAGLIDGWTETSVEFDDSAGTGYWNNNVRPQVELANDSDFSKLDFKSMRAAGLTAALIAPKDGILKGQSSLLLLTGSAKNHAVLVQNVAQHLQLTVRRGRGRGYPNSPMGAYALARQALHDAAWYGEATGLAKSNPRVPRPEFNQSLQALQAVVQRKQPVVIDTSNELFALRADRFAREFGLNLIILGSGNEYRRSSEIVEAGNPLILPVNFPTAPDVSTPEMARDVNLETLMHWDHAPANPAVLEKLGVKFVFTSKGLKNKKDLLKNVRTAVQRGLSKSAALHALTMGPAELFGVANQLGSIEKNKIANITIFDGEIFDKKSKISGVVVDGQHFDFRHNSGDEVSGTWATDLDLLSGYQLVLKQKNEKLTGYLKAIADDETKTSKKENKSGDKSAKEKEDDSAKSKIKLNSLKRSGSRIQGNFNSTELGPDALKGACLFSIVFSTGQSGVGQLTLPDGQVVDVVLNRVESEPSDDQADDDETGHDHGDDDDHDHDNDHGENADADDEDADGEDKDKNGDSDAADSQAASFPVNYPLGAYGIDAVPDQPAQVLITNMTLWTLDDRGKMEGAAILFGGGKILQVFDATAALPEIEMTLDGSGMHVTPGIIDCHSHMATDSGVNESGQAITAEVRIGDMIDPDDMTIYRQLAGGVTTSNILHGSANPIGGQNQVIKLRWGSNEQQMKFEGAPEGIKFALGENVKQSNWTNPTNRYPQTRMGVEQIIDDALRAAKDYDRRWQDWNRDRKGLPPRRDLELDALVEIIQGKRWIHCHSYRQDEILALIRTLDAHGITIGSFQHILEGYKVADAMAKHGATGSAFADWWAYKYEVKDAIPYAGALMHEAGVVVSFNSDDGELGRRLNHEAAKAVRYGGVDEVEALKFVTLNAAKQLRIDGQVGSLVVGKDADLVLWSGHPLSPLSRVRQTWVDGRKYFDIEQDQQRSDENQIRRNALIQKILTSGQKMQSANKSTIDPAKLWPRYDEFCGHHEHHDHDDDHFDHAHDHGDNQ